MSRSSAVPTGNLYGKYETHNRLERWIVSSFLRRLERALAGPCPRRVLDVGTGEGVVAERVAGRFPGALVVGVDLTDERLGAQWRRRALRGVVADAACLPFADGSFELVLAIEILEHLERPEVALAEIARVARGGVVLSVPREPLWRIGNLLRGRYRQAWGNTPGHVQHWGFGEFVRLVSRHLRVVARWRPLPWTMVVAQAPDARRH